MIMVWLLVYMFMICSLLEIIWKKYMILRSEDVILVIKVEKNSRGSSLSHYVEKSTS